jgi:hypothetical protein
VKASTQDILAVLIAQALHELADTVFADGGVRDLIGRLGWDLPSGVENIGFAIAKFRSVIDALNAIVGATKAERDDELLMAGRFIDMSAAVEQVFRDLDRVMRELSTLPAMTTDYINQTRIHEQLVRRLLDYLVITLVQRHQYQAARALTLLGLFEVKACDSDTVRYQPAYVAYVVHWERLGILVSDPARLVTEVYGWSTTQFNCTALLRNVALLLDSVGASVQSAPLPRIFEERLLGRSIPQADTDPMPQVRINLLGERVDVVEAGISLVALRESAIGASDVGLGLFPFLQGEPVLQFPLPGSSDWQVEINLGLDVEGGLLLQMRPGQPLQLQSGLFEGGVGSAALAGRLTAGLRYVTPLDNPARPLWFGAGSGLEVNGFCMIFDLAFDGQETAPGFLIELKPAALVIAGGVGDGFLASVLPADGLAVEFDLGIGWSTTRGLYFTGSASLEADLPVHVDILGVLLIETIHLGLDGSDTGLEARVAADIELHLGPVSATVLGLGLCASMATTQAGAQGGSPPAGATLGPLQAQIGIQPPWGVSLAIDAEVVKGAGFILNDYERGRYAGGLSLSIADVVSVDALGLITTTLPDGSEGFSMLVILTATFPPIQLGFGFTLTGLGGLLGVHRTMDLPVLRDKVRTGVLDSILFPVNPLGRIVQVLNDVESVFPIARDRFTVGLMARLGWGSPQTIQADIGLILSLPMPISIALLGRVSAILPDPEAAIVELRIDVAGGLDLGRQELWIEAVLRDSRVAIFELSGGFALRSSWGPDPVFLLSVGGFNPHFTPPPDFRAPDRLAISLATSDNPRIRLEAYLAITSNSLQIGARLDAFGSMEFLGVWSAHVYASFDALFTFEPFQFIVDLAGGVQICHDGKPFLGASFLLSLQGPEPLRAIGYVEVVFLGTHRIPLDITIGTGREQAAITAADPATLLAAAIKDQRNWSAVPPVLQQAVVTRDPEGAGLLVHPAGSLTFRQRVVPLEVRFELFGGQPVPGGWAQFTLTYSVGGPPPTNPALPKIRDAWAPADLFPLSDAERISQPSFTQLVSGHSGIGSTTAGTSGPGVPVNLNEFETSVIDADDWLPRRMSRPADEPSISAAVLSGAHRASLAQSGDRWGARAESMAVTCVEPQYRVVAADSLTPQGDTLFDSWVEAGASAGGDPRLLVVPAHEARAR